MKGDTLASGGKSANFGPANTQVTQEQWDKAFGKTQEEKDDERRKRDSKSNS